MTTAGDIYFIEVDTKQVSQKTLYRNVSLLLVNCHTNIVVILLFFSVTPLLLLNPQNLQLCMQRMPKNKSLRNLEVFSTVHYTTVISPEYNPGSTPQMLYSI